MATRRARIKAVANLPVRRKPVTATQCGSDLENRSTANSPSNLLNSTACDTSIKTSTLKHVMNTQNSDIILTEISIETECNITAITKAVEIENPVKVPNDTSAENNSNEKPTNRRRITKPLIKDASREKSVINSTPSEQFSVTDNVNPISFVEQTIDNYNEIAHELESVASPIKQESESVININNNSVKPMIDVITVDNDDSLFNAPASPSKNRPRIRPPPRFGHRRNSIQGSASESEDDSRKNQINFPPNRIRTESSSSIINDTSSEPPMSPRKEKFKPRQRSRRTEQSQKLIERKKEFAYKFGTTTPDRSSMTVFDMIFYNPRNNPMKQPESKSKEMLLAKTIQQESVDDPTQADDEEEEEETIAVPQLKMGLNGEIIVDEQSLVIETTGTKKAREKLANSSIVYDSDLNSSYGIYKKHKRCKDWKPAETIRFYKTLNRIGTDFSMMQQLFPERSRRDLKHKFKKEEKINGALIDKAIKNPKTFDMDVLEKQFKAEQEEADKVEKEKKIEKKTPKKRTKKIRLYESSEESQDDGVDNVNNGLLTMAQKADPDIFKKYKVPVKRGKTKRDLKKKKYNSDETIPMENVLASQTESIANTNNLEVQNGILILANTAINQPHLQENSLGVNNNEELQKHHVNDLNTHTKQSCEQGNTDVYGNNDITGLFNGENLTQSCTDLIDLQIQENISKSVEDHMGLAMVEGSIFCEDQIDALMIEADNNLYKDYVNKIHIESTEINQKEEYANNVITSDMESSTCQSNQINLANGSAIDISEIPIEIDNIGAYDYNQTVEKNAENVDNNTLSFKEKEAAMNDNIVPGSFVINAKPCPARPDVTIYEVFMKTVENGKHIMRPIELTEDELQSVINNMIPVTE